MIGRSAHVFTLVGVLAVLLFARDARTQEDPFSGFSGESSLSFGYGYADNVLYSEIAPIDAAFALVNVEAQGGRTLFSERVFLDLLLFGELRSFNSLPGVSDQSVLLLQSELSSFVGLYSEWLLGGRYLGLTQAFDATFDVLDRQSFLLELKEPELYVGFETFFWMQLYEFEGGVSKATFESPGNDYASLNWQLDVSQQINRSIDFVSQISGYVRDYDDRLARDSSGAALAGIGLEMEQYALESGFHYDFEAGRVSHAFELLLAYEQRSDGQEGYYDRTRRSLNLEWVVETEKTSFGLRVGRGGYRYAVQTVGDGSAQKSDGWTWSVEWERSLNVKWSVFGLADGESEDSNDEFSSYDAASLVLGMKWYP